MSSENQCTGCGATVTLQNGNFWRDSAGHIACGFNGDIHRVALPPVAIKPERENDLTALEVELLLVLEEAQEELRLLRMKDTGVVYNPGLRSRISALVDKARNQKPIKPEAEEAVTTCRHCDEIIDLQEMPVGMRWYHVDGVDQGGEDEQGCEGVHCGPEFPDCDAEPYSPEWSARELVHVSNLMFRHKISYAEAVRKAVLGAA